MTLYELADNVTIQGNVEIIKFENGLVANIWSVLGTTDIRIDFYSLEDFEGVEDLEVTYIYNSKNEDGTSWVVIEVAAEEE